MRAKISALMDGELEGSELAASLAAIGARDGEAYEAWCLYHIVGDALCGTRPLSEAFNARFAQRLAAEPTVLAPAAARAQPERRRWIALSAAASIAAAALVGWLSLAPQGGVGTAPVQIAQAPVRAAPPMAVAAAAKAPARVPLPREADDYLLAHQSYSLRSSLQGMMPYVRTVAVENVAGRP
ncbi:MAG: RseA family anti-sigma factor [Betaproteobacteria bacterium]|nr:RseA family anti-sigma factor [Betaproteobacteria bacterium]